jgi:hypothetical protein
LRLAFALVIAMLPLCSRRAVFLFFNVVAASSRAPAETAYALVPSRLGGLSQTLIEPSVFLTTNLTYVPRMDTVLRRPRSEMPCAVQPAPRVLVCM